MYYRATVSFAGEVSMKKGETRELSGSLAVPLLKCGYLEEVKEKEDKQVRKIGNYKSSKGAGR